MTKKPAIIATMTTATPPSVTKVAADEGVRDEAAKLAAKELVGIEPVNDVALLEALEVVGEGLEAPNDEDDALLELAELAGLVNGIELGVVLGPVIAVIRWSVVVCRLPVCVVVTKILKEKETG